MYIIKSSSQYKKSIKKIRYSGKFNEDELNRVIDNLASGKKLTVKYKDHSLTGGMSMYRECHIESDLLLIYRVYDSDLI